MKKTKARTEELETTGIIGNTPFSENKLREEHNINLTENDLPENYFDLREFSKKIKIFISIFLLS